MKNTISKLTDEQRKEIAALKELPDDSIDTTDPSETIDWSMARRGVFYRPVKQQITLRLDADVVAWFKQHAGEGRGYQSEINRALRRHVQHSEKLAERSASEGGRDHGLADV